MAECLEIVTRRGPYKRYMEDTSCPIPKQTLSNWRRRGICCTASKDDSSEPMEVDTCNDEQTTNPGRTSNYPPMPLECSPTATPSLACSEGEGLERPQYTATPPLAGREGEDLECPPTATPCGVDMHEYLSADTGSTPIHASFLVL